MKIIKVYTLVFIKTNENILLGRKTRGLGEGFWNGFGGKVEKGETVIETARRELKEESGLKTDYLKQIGAIIYEDDSNDIIAVIHVFTSNKFKGKILPSEEMSPLQWFQCSQLPFEQMWPDSIFWYNLMLDDKYFTVKVTYSKNGEIKHKEIKEFGNYDFVMKKIDRLINKYK